MLDTVHYQQEKKECPGRTSAQKINLNKKSQAVFSLPLLNAGVLRATME